MHVAIILPLTTPLYRAEYWGLMLKLTLIMQVYIVSGGRVSSGSYLASTEILEKDGGTAWQYVASLPSKRSAFRGVGLDHGRFMVTGECFAILCHYNNNSWWSAGGYNGSSYIDEVLLYNSEEDEWTTVGHLSTARAYHAMSLVPGSTADFCLWFTDNIVHSANKWQCRQPTLCPICILSEISGWFYK